MQSGRRRILVLGLAVGLASAVPVAISHAWGWIGTAAIACGGAALLSADLGRRLVRPVEQLAGVVRPYIPLPDASSEDLARLVAFEFRDVVSRLGEAVDQSRRREVALANTSDGVVLIDGNGLVDYANPALRAQLHDRVVEITHRLAEPQLARLVRQSQEVQASQAVELTLRMPAARHVLARAVPLAGGGTVLVLQDLSEAYRLDRVRRDFVANVSHELKTPVAGMRALSDVAVSALEDGDLESAARFIARVQTEGERLSDLVADLLDLSRVESGQDMRVEQVDIRGLLEDAVDHVKTAAEAKGVGVEVSGFPVLIDADASQLGAALKNLVDNAVRYSERGTVRASVSAEDGWMAASVSDEGIGIPADELARIFERFYRVDRARSRETGGTGLGLAIVRHVAENHGGRVDVHSELGAGSTFTLHLPAPGADREGTAA